MAARNNNNPEGYSTVANGPSGNDGFAELQKYFGPISRQDYETHAADRFAHTTHNLPKGRCYALYLTCDLYT